MTKLDEIVLKAAKYAWVYDDACPDVGMGPNAEMILDRVLKGTRVSEQDFNYWDVLKLLKIWRKERK